MSGVQVAADLRAAAEVLRRDGWTQGGYHSAESHCAVGAIRVAAGYEVCDHWGVWVSSGKVGAAERVTAALAFASPGGDETSLAAWNDAPGRTADEVIAALEAAADAAEASDV